VGLPDAFAPLMGYRRWVTWDAYPDPEKPGKTIKRPTDVRTGAWCDSNNPEHQYPYADAVATGRRVGFVFDQADGFWFFDIDGALEAAPGGGYQWSPLASQICDQLRGAAIEVSQSGTGLHIVGRGAVPEHSCKNIVAHLELYTHQRFIALTGHHAQGSAGFDATPAITALAERFFPPNPHGDIAGWTDEPTPEFSGPSDDGELIRAALASGKKSAAAAFGDNHVTFEDLWTANEDALAKRWPSDKGGYDASQADGALASHLAYWTGKNCERIRTLMFQSALVREKWDRVSYIETTIIKAASVVTNVAQGRAPPPVPGTDPTAAAGLALRAPGQEFLGSDQQLEFFAGCVYVISDNKIWIPSTGDMLDKARFDVVYAGHVFPVDGQNDKVTDSAWDAFTRSRVFSAPRVDRMCFRPEEPAGGVVYEDGRTMVNTYLPITTRREAGDASPFLDHLAKMLPDERDRSILLHYMASMRQNPGVKFQWWPVIQGVEGNGKTMLDRIMSFAIGQRYSHLVNPEAMAKTGNQFNMWVQGNLYLGIEEIYVNNRRDFLDSFKATVTNDRVPMEGKGTNQGTGDNRLNGLMFTNHFDAVPISVDSRRYSIFFTAQQSAADLGRDGMGGSYFPDLYDWLYGRRAYAACGANHGLAIVNDMLATFPLRAELDPAQLCVRAPATTSTASALRFSLGRAEQEILEAIEEGRAGFCGGWVSSIMVDRLLDQLRINLPRIKRRDLLASLGYDLHPALVDGRVNNAIQPDNGKPRLYVGDGHLSLNLTDPAAVAKAYTLAQNTVVSDAAAARFGAK
jgi:hypothetical protein